MKGEERPAGRRVLAMPKPLPYDLLLRDAPDPVVVLHSDRTVRYANPAFRALAHRAREGVDFMDLVAFHARERVGGELVKAAGGEEILLDVPHPTEEERARVVEYHFFPVEGGMVAGIGRLRSPDQALREQLGRARAELRQKSRLLDEIQMELTLVPFIDPATGVWNRLQVIERLTGEWSRSERWGSPLGCVMIEVEGVALLRRREGDAIANEVLKAVARRLKSVTRDHDIVGRWGGHRFVVIAVQADAGGLRSLCDRMYACVRDEPVRVAGRSVEVSLRLGATTNRMPDVEIMEDLFTVADTALVDARSQGVPCLVVGEGAS